MNRYNYHIGFKFDGDNNHSYNMNFTIEAESNDEAKIKGNERWLNQVNTRSRLKDAKVFKITCRKIETKPRQVKRTALQNALSALNAYILEDLSK